MGNPYLSCQKVTFSRERQAKTNRDPAPLCSALSSRLTVCRLTESSTPFADALSAQDDAENEVGANISIKRAFEFYIDKILKKWYNIHATQTL